MQDFVVSGKIPGTNFVITFEGFIATLAVLLGTAMFLHVHYMLSQPWPRARRYAGRVVRPAGKPNYLQNLYLQTGVAVTILKNV